MDDPIKIIHKYKNNNGRIQYHINIFIGDIVDDDCMRILVKIKTMNLYSALTSLNSTEIQILEKNYGEYWYEKFFNSYHIINTLEITQKNPDRMRELRSLYNEKWVTNHFFDYTKRMETTIFNYEYAIKEERERKTIKKNIRRQQEDVEELLDYTTTNNISDTTFNLSRINYVNNEISDDKNWCSENSDDEELTENELREILSKEFELKNGISNYNTSDEDVSDSDMSDNDISDNDISNNDSEIEKKNKYQTGGQEEDEYNANFDDPIFDEFDFTNVEDDPDLKVFETEVEEDLQNLDLLFSDIDETDKNAKLTTKEIKAAISNEQYDNIKILDFDESKDNSMFDENLKDVIDKNYVTQQYIYKDDTIKIIRDKICCGFKNSIKYGKNSYIIPSHQYLWAEYLYENKIDKVMLGQKWIIRNDILKLDVEPNSNISVYEELRGNLRMLRDNIRRYGKIKREDDDNNILYDYEGYYTFNEIYMVDIYNEMGLNYDPNFEEQRNFIDVYLKIYFPKIRPEDLNNILDYLDENNTEVNKSIEQNKIKMVYETIKNNLILENEPMRDIELTKKTSEQEYLPIFKENYVTQSVIRAYLLKRGKKLDLFRVFDNFILDEYYPFIQYLPADGTPRSRYNERYLIENERKEIIMKWFENIPYGNGISFKVRVNEQSDYKYMAINLGENGRIDYKIQWKEDDKFTVDDISKTYIHIKNLIKKINSENARYGIKLKMPTDEDFKFAFINTIQRFELPDNFTINHNDFSEFSRYFFPYVALVIEPRKRQSKVKKLDREERSKFGTYLRYKRISKYENKTKIEHRIVFFMRNYEYNDNSLANEISNEFNITEEQAIEEIVSVREKYPNIKKSRKILKKLENIPKYKPPGIGVDIQGKKRNNYKMRIAGARDREQLNRIISFMNILVYLYTETYLYKRPDRQNMKERLKKLTRIAHRRNKVSDIIKPDNPIKTVKQITAIDKKRLSNKSDDDQNQWTRDCQNSGEDKKRRPQQFLNVEELQKLGYTWNDTLAGFEFGHYERRVMIDKDGNTESNKKKHEVTLRAVKLLIEDTGDFVYYVCSPEENGKHIYVGFLKSKNQQGDAKPCCFIKDHLYSKNKEKRNLFLRSIGIVQPTDNDINKITGDQLYILQDSNKIQEGRFAFLPKYLDVFLNFMLNNTRTIKNHYLISTESGYYFKYGTRQDEYRYVNALCTTLDLSIDEFKSKLINALLLDENLVLFTSLNNGDIRTQFENINSYISYIKTNEYLEYPLLNDLISAPGVITKQGINIIIFQRKIKVIKKSFEKESTREHYYIICQNQENLENIVDPKRDNILIIKENKNYYPIIFVEKPDEDSKDVDITKTFKYENEDNNIINHIFKYYSINCQPEYRVLVSNKSNINLNAKETNKILKDLGNDEYLPEIQVIDTRFKCKYIITRGKYIIPTMPSGTIINLKITTDISPFLTNFDNTFKYLSNIYKLSNKMLKIKPIGIFYSDRQQKNYTVSAIMTQGYETVPIIEQTLSSDYIKKENLLIQNRPNDDIIDKEILKGPGNIFLDDRVLEVSKSKYNIETYQLFRYHLSFFLNNTTEGSIYKERINDLINDNSSSKRIRKLNLKKLIYQMTDEKLAETFDNLISKLNLENDDSRIQSRLGKINMTAGQDQIAKSVHVNPLSQAEMPVSISHQKQKSIQIIPENFTMGQRNSDQNLNEDPDVSEFDYSEQINPLNAPFDFTANSKIPLTENVNFPTEEKKWLNIISESKLDYPSFILRNNRELCFADTNKNACESNMYCSWNNEKNLCLFSVTENQLVDFINQVAEEFIQNEFKASEILQRGEYFVSNIVDYNVFTERPGERIIMSSNANLERILSEIFGKENIPRIGKKRYKFENTLDYEQMNINNPLRENNNWYIQNIIDNNNSIFRAFVNVYYWLVHPYNEISIRNLGYYSTLQNTLSNIYKSQVIDWLLSPENNKHIQKIMPYMRYNKIGDFAIKLSMEVNTITNGIVELYVLSKIYETIIYIYSEYYDIMYVIHPTQGIVYDYKKNKNEFDTSEYRNYKKNVNLRFNYTAGSNYPEIIDALYPK
ncbi:poxvirus early transcription factor-like protein [Cotonvirus japonicus]|uniref:Poxvirus early transcription factor-like protein n=1 Tax=Cotonvirus japonicus TaxID=2811091 RepID=A0ABM7NT52_9VIRU|nr:poxvirus early transcription factor-like protein [Cotonvirus japonicus]BCS83257.1 poxvirus early transcription factor-like protein [Cotonvirus japonicus]